jgi:hypothetical protein
MSLNCIDANFVEICNVGFHLVGEVRVVTIILSDGIKPDQTNDHNVTPFCLQRLPIFAMEPTTSGE